LKTCFFGLNDYVETFKDHIKNQIWLNVDTKRITYTG
jgi:hypothetical protein